MSSDGVRYQLTLNSRQARLVAHALDFWSRCKGGQLEALKTLNWRAASKRPDFNHDLNALKRALFPGLPLHASDFSAPEVQEAFNVRKILEHAYSWTEQPLPPGELQTVNYDGPLSDFWQGEPAEVLVVRGGVAAPVGMWHDRVEHDA